MRFRKFIKKLLDEATTTGGYPDFGGIVGDDDAPPGNILIGPKYRKSRKKQIGGVETVHYEPYDDFQWDEFDKAVGQHRMTNYDKTLLALKDIYGDRIFKHMRWIKSKGFRYDIENIERLKVADDENKIDRPKDNKEIVDVEKDEDDITKKIDKVIKSKRKVNNES